MTDEVSFVTDDNPSLSNVHRCRGCTRNFQDMSLQGAIFDWDGVVVDSAAQHERSWEMLAEEEGLPLPEDHFVKGFGKVNKFIIPNLLNWTQDPDEISRLDLRKEELYRDLIREGGIEELAGARTLLAALKAAGIPTVVGSSTPRTNLEVALEVLGLEDFFQDLVSANDVTHGKPDPEVFLKAAGKINSEPTRCVVFEDSLHGIEAGLAGGMQVVAVATTHTQDELTQAHKVVHRLTDLCLNELNSLFTES